MINILKLLQKINETSPTPLYYQVAESIQNIIKINDIKSGTKLPSEEMLALHFGVSRPTIKKALEVLIKKSLLYRDKRKGTFIREKEIKLTLVAEPLSFGDSLKNAGVNYSTEVLKLESIKSNKKISKALKLKPKDLCIHLRRLRYMDDEPFLLIESFIPNDIFPGLLDIDFSKYSLFSVYREKYNRKIDRVERYMRVVRASDEEALLFSRVPVGDPLLQMEGYVHCSQGRIIEYFITKIVGNKIVFYTTLYANKK